MYELGRLICDIGNRSPSVRTDPSIRLSGMGPLRTRSSDTERLVLREDSSDLKRLPTTISFSEGKNEEECLTCRKSQSLRESDTFLLRQLSL